MNAAYAVQGDVNDIRHARIGGVEDLATATALEAHVWYYNRRTLVAETLVATVVDPVERIVAVHLGAVAGWLSDAAAVQWNVEVQVTWGDGSKITYPSPRGQAWVNVRSDGDPPPSNP